MNNNDGNGKEELSHLALEALGHNINREEKRKILSFPEFIRKLEKDPEKILRNIFQRFNDFIKFYVGEGKDDSPDDPEKIGFIEYDCSKIFVEGMDNPFFADMLFANRFIRRIGDLKGGVQQNKIHVFIGPHGCGKSTFLNNLLKKFEEYSNLEEGEIFETVWRINGDYLREACKDKEQGDESPYEIEKKCSSADIVEVPCPSHDNPILIIPKKYRADFLEKLFSERSAVKLALANEKEYEWVLKEEACTICQSLFWALFDRVGDIKKVLDMLFARVYKFDRRLGEGISIFNPGDKPIKKLVLTDEKLQERINKIFGTSNEVQYIFSQFAKTNNGIYALMDVKDENQPRFMELHNIISEGVHKVDLIEEKVKSLFVALMNPSDLDQISSGGQGVGCRNEREEEDFIDTFDSFRDRISEIVCLYVLDPNTEVKIYESIFGEHVKGFFLPRVLENFARVIISTRMKKNSAAINDWIPYLNTYDKYCDSKGLLLRMDIYGAKIPEWLSEEDRKKFTAKIRRAIISEAEEEESGDHGFSGRDSLRLFDDFQKNFGGKEKLINMDNLNTFFSKLSPLEKRLIPGDFLGSLEKMYNFTVLQEVKESLYSFNEDRISKDIQNYLFALSFDMGTTVKCNFTGEKIKIDASLFDYIEGFILGSAANDKRIAFRKETQKAFVSKTITQEINLENKSITETELYKDLYQRYVNNLKDGALEPFLKNPNFRIAIKAYGTKEFKTFDKHIKEGVELLIKNLCTKFNYTEQGAKEISLYVIDKDLAKFFPPKSTKK